MATISTQKIFLKTGENFIKKVTYSNGKFRIKLPERLCKELNYNDSISQEVSGENEEQVNFLFATELKKWIEVIEVVKKVILFDSKFTGAFLQEHKWADWNKEYNGGYQPYWKSGTNKSMSQGIWDFCHEDLGMNNSSLGLTINWGIYEKTDINGKLSYKFISGRDLNLRWGINNHTEIDHTPEREKFFLELDESFARMIAKVYKALGDLTPDKLLALADSNQKLLG